MEFAEIPRAGVRVSRVALGCEPLGGTDWGTYSLDDACRAVTRAADLGVNFFDVADVYGLGLAEENLARALGSKRHEMVIATKCGVAWREAEGGRAQTFRCLSPDYVVQATEASLRRMQLDRLPLLFLHWPDPGTPLAATADALNNLLDRGLIGGVGISNHSVAQIEEISKSAPIAVVQCGYSLLDRHVEADLLPFCLEAQIPVMAYGPLAQGMLTGKVANDTVFDSSDRRHRLPHFSADERSHGIRVAAHLVTFGAERGKSAGQVAVRWVLEHPAVACAIVGAKRPEQVEENLGALDWQLRRADIEAVLLEDRSGSSVQTQSR